MATPVRVGVIKPTATSNSLQDLEALLPSDVELVPEYMGFAYRNLDEFARAMPAYAEKIAALAAKGCDMIHPEGAPPFMLQGLAEERRLIAAWEALHRVPVFTTGTTQLAALHALGVRRFAGFSPFDGALADAFAAYFRDAGFDVLAMGRPATADDNLYDLPRERLAQVIVSAYRAVPGRPEALYLLGSEWRALDVIEEVEAQLGVPVLHPVVVRCWYILRRLGRTGRYERHGRLLRRMPLLKPV